jgi:hypothetical protein
MLGKEGSVMDRNGVERESAVWVVLLGFSAIISGLLFLLYLFLFATDPTGQVAGLPYPVILAILSLVTPGIAVTAVRAARQRALSDVAVPAKVDISDG